jgi:hypothetical protein
VKKRIYCKCSLCNYLSSSYKNVKEHIIDKHTYEYVVEEPTIIERYEYYDNDEALV